MTLIHSHTRGCGFFWPFGQNCFGFIPLNPDAVTPLLFSFYFSFLFSFSLFLLLISFCPSPFSCRKAN